MLASISDVGRRFARPPRRTPEHKRTGAMNCHLLKDIGFDCSQARWMTGSGPVGRSGRE